MRSLIRMSVNRDSTFKLTSKSSLIMMWSFSIKTRRMESLTNEADYPDSTRDIIKLKLPGIRGEFI